MKVVPVEIDGAPTVETALRDLAARCDPCFLELLDGRPKSQPWLHWVMLNDRRLVLPDELAAPVSDGDRLYFLRPTAGG